MHLEDLKRWHWIVIGLLVGLVFGYVQSEFGADGYRVGGSKDMSSSRLEALLCQMGDDMQGHPTVRDVRVLYNADGHTFTLNVLDKPLNGTRQTATRWQYVPYELTVHSSEPYEPLFDRGGAGNTIDIKVRPDSRRRRAGVELTGW